MSQEEIVAPKGWELKKISEITESYSGGTPSTSKMDYWENGTIPWLRSGKLKDNIITSSDDFITQLGLDNSSAKIYPPETILVAITGATTGKTAFLKINACGTQNVFGITPCDEIIPKYMWYYMRYYYKKLISKSIGGAQGHVNGTIIRNTPIQFPKKISIQKQIVAKLDHILGELEVKKKEILSLIEQNKQRIDFFEKNWMSYVIEREIEKHPKRKEWELKKISQVCDVNPSKSEIKDLPDDTLVSFIPMRNVDDKDGIIKIHDEELLGKVRKGFTYFRNNDVIFAKITPCMENGKIAIGMNLKNDVGFGSTEFHVLRPHDQILSEFIHYFLRNKSFRVEAKQNFTGSAGQKRVPKDFLENHSIPIPSISVQRKIIQNIKSAEQKFKSQKKQFENIKNNYESKINYINHIQSSVLDSAFSGKLLN